MFKKFNTIKKGTKLNIILNGISDLYCLTLIYPKAINTES